MTKKRFMGRLAFMFAAIISLSLGFGLFACGTSEENNSQGGEPGTQTHVHSYEPSEEAEWSWSEDYTKCQAAGTCTNEDGLCEALEGTVYAEISSETTIEPTCEEVGYATYTAKYRGKTVAEEVVELPALGHAYTVTFIWEDEDESGIPTATANYECARDSAHSGSLAAEITENLDGTYTASITLDKKYESEPYSPAANDEYAVIIENQESALTVGDSITLLAYVTKNGIKDENLSVEWSANPSGLVEISEGILTAIGEGTVTLTASFKDATSEKILASTSFSIEISGAISSHTHTYSAPSWDWEGSDEEGYTTAKATFTCTADGGGECSWEDNTYSITYTLEDSDIVEIDSTCTAAGKITYTAHVTLGGNTYSDTKEIEIPQKEHTYEISTGENVWTWTEDETEDCIVSATATCSVCGASTTVYAQVSSKKTEATCGEAGYTTYTATYNGETVDTLVVAGEAATGDHTCSLEGATWIWSEEAGQDGNYSCTAQVLCSVCEKEILLNATVSSEDISATCGEAGYTKYTATYSGNEVSTKKVVNESAPATGEHQYVVEENGWTWTEIEGGYTCSAKALCSVCGDESVVKAEVTYESHAATCVEAGYTEYTATYEGSTVSTKTITGEQATGVHTYSQDSEISWDWSWHGGEFVATATIKCDICKGEYIAEGGVTGPKEYGEYSATLTIPTEKNAAGENITYTDTHTENYQITIGAISNIVAGERYSLEASVTLDGSAYTGDTYLEEEIKIKWEISEGSGYAVIEADTGILSTEAEGNIKIKATFITKDNREISSEISLSIGKNPTPKIADLDFDYEETYSFITSINFAGGENESAQISAGRALTSGILTLQTRSSGTMTVGANSSGRYGLKTNAATTTAGGYIIIDLSDYIGKSVTISADMSSYSGSNSLILATEIATSTTGEGVIKYIESSNSTNIVTLLSDSFTVEEGKTTYYITWTGYIYLYSLTVRISDSSESAEYSVKIDSTEEEIKVGDEISLGATVYVNGIPYKTLSVIWSWESSDGGVVELGENTGYLKGVTEGTIKITATFALADGTIASDEMEITVVAAEKEAKNLVHIDFTDSATSTTWLGISAPSLDSYNSISSDTTDPTGYITLKANSTSGADLRYTYTQNRYENQDTYYTEDYYALRIGNYNTNNTVGSYIEINVENLVGKEVSIAVEAAWATGTNMPTLVLATGLGTTTTGNTILSTLTIPGASDRTPYTLSWNGEIEEGWSTLYLNTTGYSVYILSIDMVVYESMETEKISVVHLDFEDSNTYSWIGSPNETPSDTSSNYTTISENKSNESEPITLKVNSGNEPRLGYLDNSAEYYTYHENYVALRIGTTSALAVGSYFEIDVENYIGQEVEITICGSAAGGNATDFMLATDTSVNTSGSSVLAYQSLTAWDRTPTKITWTGIIEESYTKLYVKAVTHQTYIISIDMQVCVPASEKENTTFAHLDLSDPDTYGWLGVSAPENAGTNDNAILSSSLTSVTDGGILSIVHASGSDYPTLRRVDNSSYNTEDYVAIYLKGSATSAATAQNYIGIDVSGLVGESVTISVDVAWYSGSGVYLVLASSLGKASSGTGVIESIALEASNREAKTLTWTGTIDESWSTLYLYGYSSAVYILSVDVVEAG